MGPGLLFFMVPTMVLVTSAETKTTPQILCYAVDYLSLHKANSFFKRFYTIRNQASWFLSCIVCSNSQTEIICSGKIKLSIIEDHIHYLHKADSDLSPFCNIELHLKAKHLISEFFGRFYSFREGFIISEVIQLLVGQFHTFPKYVWIWVNHNGHLAEIALYIPHEEHPLK